MKKLINLLKPYTLTVYEYDGTVFKHRAWTVTDALEWSACYGRGCGLRVIRSRTGRLIASIEA
jgi:hypothetical protein